MLKFVSRGIALIVVAMLWWVGTVLAAQADILSFYTWKPGIPAPWEKLIEQFERENPDIRIQIQVGPQSSTQFHAILSQRLKNQDASVDVFFMDVVWPPEFASAGWALDLTSRFPAEERKRFLPGPIAANSFKGKIYGVPTFLDAGLLFYRKDLLGRCGFGPPVTWSEMLEQGDEILGKAREPDLSIYSAQFKQYEGLVCNMLEFIWSNGGEVLKPDSGKVLVGEPSAVKAIAFVRDQIIGKAAPKGVLSYEEPESLALFMQGKAVFHRNWPYAWRAANDPAQSKVAGKVGVAGLPAFAGHNPAAALGGWQLGISRWSRHPDKAWRFVRFMTSAGSQKILALEAGRAPTRKAVYQDREVQNRVPHLKMFLPAFEHARPRPVSPLYPIISQTLQRFFSKAISDPTSDIPTLAKAAAGHIRRFIRLGNPVQH